MCQALSLTWIQTRDLVTTERSTEEAKKTATVALKITNGPITISVPSHFENILHASLWTEFGDSQLHQLFIKKKKQTFSAPGFSYANTFSSTLFVQM